MKTEDARNFLGAAMVLGVSGAVERQEADGQRSVVAGDTIPVTLQDCTEADLIGMGFTLGDKVDDLFRACTLPAGWSKRRTDHHLWSNIVDDKGRIRFSIGYKAAFYDRWAHMRAEHRYTVATRDDGAGGDVGQVMDGATVLHETIPFLGDRSYRLARDAARGWLAESFPDYENPGAYWD